MPQLIVPSLAIPGASLFSDGLLPPMLGQQRSVQKTDIARLIKGRSSHELREEYAHLKRMPSLWTRSTFYSTAGHVSADTMQKYIERQSKS